MRPHRPNAAMSLNSPLEERWRGRSCPLNLIRCWVSLIHGVWRVVDSQLLHVTQFLTDDALRQWEIAVFDHDMLARFAIDILKELSD